MEGVFVCLMLTTMAPQSDVISSGCLTGLELCCLHSNGALAMFF